MTDMGGNLTYKFSVITILAVFLVISALGAGYYFSERNNRIEDTARSAEEAADRLSNSLVYPLWNVSDEEIDRSMDLEMTNADIEAIAIYNFDGSFLEGVYRNGTRVSEVPEGGKAVADLEKRYRTIKRTVVKGSENIGSVNIIVSDTRQTGYFRDLLTRILVLIVLLTIAVFLVLFTTIRFVVLEPLLSLQKQVVEFGKGERSEIRIGSKDEIGQLAGTFNEMADKLRKNREELKVRVAERTKELEASKADLMANVAELERMNKLMVGRELKMSEMKKEIESYRKIP